MKWLETLRLSTKLILGFALMVVLVVGTGVVGYRSIISVQHRMNGFFTITLPSISNLIEADRDLYQLLVAERSMMLTPVDSEAFKAHLEDYRANMQQAKDRWGKFKSLVENDEEKAVLPLFEKARDEWEKTSGDAVAARMANGKNGDTAAATLSLGIANTRFNEMREYLNTLTESNLERADQVNSTASATYRVPIQVLFIISALSAFMGMLLAWFYNRIISRPLMRAAVGMQEASEQMTSASGQVTSASQQLAENASSQAASLEEASAFLEEISGMTRQNATDSGQANTLMIAANQAVDHANTAMDELTVSMEDISKASEETSKIIKTIDEIAFQTNLLALNAAVEAARAGEAGAGFAVVADEVRNLAMRAGEAAKSTAAMIEGTVNKVGNGSALVKQANDAFGKVAESTTTVGQLLADISAASGEQSTGIERINNSVSSMDAIVQQNAANAEENASASEEMNAQAGQVQTIVDELMRIINGTNGHANGSHGSGRAMHLAERISDQRQSVALLETGAGS